MEIPNVGEVVKLKPKGAGVFGDDLYRVIAVCKEQGCASIVNVQSGCLHTVAFSEIFRPPRNIQLGNYMVKDITWMVSGEKEEELVDAYITFAHGKPGRIHLGCHSMGYFDFQRLRKAVEKGENTGWKE